MAAISSAAHFSGKVAALAMKKRPSCIHSRQSVMATSGRGRVLLLRAGQHARKYSRYERLESRIAPAALNLRALADTLVLVT
eukprot:5505089-Pleurochrysis_carterae.AAC.1